MSERVAQAAMSLHLCAPIKRMAIDQGKTVGELLEEILKRAIDKAANEKA